MAPCEFDELGRAHHGAVVGHDFAAQAAGREAREPAEVDRGLGVAVAHEHAALLGAKREHVAGPTEVFGTRVGIERGERRAGALEGGDARRRVDVVDAHREGGLVVVGVLRDHRGEAEPVAQVARHGHADEAPAVDGHEVDVVGRGEFARADEVAFVFSVLVVGDEDDLAGAKVFERLFNGIERMGHVVFLPEGDSGLRIAKGPGRSRSRK